MSISDYGAQQWSGVMVGIGSLPPNFYVALCTDEPGDSWDGTVLTTVEPVDVTIYDRQPLVTGTDWTLSDGGFVINAAALDFGTPTVDWGLLSHFALLDAATDGNLWAFDKFLEAIEVVAGAPVSLPIATITLALTNQLSSIAE